MSEKTSSSGANSEPASRIQVKKRDVLSDQWARLEDVTFDYLRSDGRWQTQKREIYHRGHGAAILLYNVENETIVLIRQFRFPAFVEDGDGFLLEAPAGIIEKDNPEETIQAETSQETGFLIGKPEFLFKAYATPGSVTEQLFYFSASYESDRRVGVGGGLEEEGEDIEVLEVKLSEAVEWIRSGKIIDAKTIILIQYAQLNIFR